MGNCIRHESSMHWGGDDWASMASEEEEATADREGILSEKTDLRPPTPEKLVKVKVTKKQLEELLGKVDVKELSVHQAVAQLLSAADSHHRPWRPALQSIPEAN